MLCARSVLCTCTSLTLISWPGSVHIIQLQTVNTWLTFAIPRYEDLTNVSVFPAQVFLSFFPPYLLHVNFFVILSCCGQLAEICQIFQCCIILIRIALHNFHCRLLLLYNNLLSFFIVMNVVMEEFCFNLNVNCLKASCISLCLSGKKIPVIRQENILIFISEKFW